jgi:hypothetical protein
VTTQRDGDERSPAALALASFGAGRFATLVSEEQQDDWAVVLALTNEAPYLVPDEMIFPGTMTGGLMWAETTRRDGGR